MALRSGPCFRCRHGGFHSSDDETGVSSPDEDYPDGYSHCQRLGCGRKMCHGNWVYTHCCKPCYTGRFLHDIDCDADFIRERIYHKSGRGPRDLRLLCFRKSLRLCIKKETNRFLQTCIRNWRLCIKKETPRFLRTCIRNWVLMQRIRVYLRAKWLLLARMAMTPPLLRMD